MKRLWKRILAAACAGAMLMTSVVYASDGMWGLMNFTDNILPDGSLIYYFDEVAITLPADWNGKIDLKTDGTTAVFYHKASREKWQENYGSDGGKLFSLSCSVNDDFAELPDYSYIGFCEESVMNYFLIFPTDFQAYTEDAAVAEEYSRMYAEIDFVRDNARMLGTTVEQPETSTAEDLQERLTGKVGDADAEVQEYWFDEKTAGYEGTWVTMEDGFEVYLPSAWNVVEVSDDERKDGIAYIAASEDTSLIYTVMTMALGEEYTAEEIQTELAKNNMTMTEFLKEQLISHGYICEAEVNINGIPSIIYTQDDYCGTVFMDQSGMSMEMTLLMGEDLTENETAEAILHSVRWVS
ncbi:MAG: hypothetical protein Q4C50_06955 [Eubacteriales bacterium]|nr:hypothetical protein [Eubacteriales bacterium]